MKAILTMLLGLGMAVSASPETINFDEAKTGELPPGWLGGVTGSGTPKWSIATDESAPSKPNVARGADSLSGVQKGLTPCVCPFER